MTSLEEFEKKQGAKLERSPISPKVKRGGAKASIAFWNQLEANGGTARDLGGELGSIPRGGGD